MKKIYKMKLTTIGPVHIGSNQVLKKAGYIFDKYNEMIYIPDEIRLLKWFIEKNLIDKFEKYLFKEAKEANLFKFLKENKLLKEFKEYMAYSFSTSSSKTENLNDIALTIKDKELNPYIPGSSLKGAIRTALLGNEIGMMNKDNEKMDFLFRYLKNNKLKELEKNGKRFINEILRSKEKKQNIMKYIKISDSEPLSREDLILAQKIDYTLLKNKNNYISIFRESIKPGTHITFHLILEEELGLDIEDIKEAINNFYLDIDSSFLSKFGIEERDEGYIYIGGGTGFPSKNLIYSYLGEEGAKVISKILESKFKNHKHYKDLKLGVSPRTIKKTKVDNLELEMGLCKFAFEEVKLL